jgi:hypothetical protein
MVDTDLIPNKDYQYDERRIIVVKAKFVDWIHFKKNEKYKQHEFHQMQTAIENGCIDESSKIRNKILQLYQHKMNDL